ncbi:hypothetical protein DET0420 [Dehalococcoides mccartyi 195]|uniref:Uncharacterized protein n=1 Tax=Dehalococcoides mccartyi (strain ATCC BAA-2266 / KCTC 15142 / 195) TaxID=243164 RepID=Q3Z9D4_DEHM1|nr:hypothetical protein DET0420 [Dehalococcoides mccartyi 195]
MQITPGRALFFQIKLQKHGHTDINIVDFVRNLFNLR